MKQLQVNEDDYNVVQAIVDATGVSEAEAVSILLEIGLVRFLIEDSTPEKRLSKENQIDHFINSPKGQQIVDRLKAIWSF